MNIYELLGRIGVLHLECENLFSEIGQIIDDKKLATTYNADDFSDSQITSIKSKLSYLRSSIDEYINLFSDNDHSLSKDDNTVRSTNKYLIELGRICNKYDIKYYINFLDVGSTGYPNLIMITIPTDNSDRGKYVVLYADVCENTIYIGRTDPEDNSKASKIYKTIRSELEKFVVSNNDNSYADLKCDKDIVIKEDSKFMNNMLGSLYCIGETIL